MNMNNFSPHRPKLVTSNLILDPEKMRQFASDHGFDGIDWSFDLAHLPATPVEESRWASRQELLKPSSLIFIPHMDVPRERRINISWTIQEYTVSKRFV